MANFAALALNLMKANQVDPNKLDNLTTHLPGIVTFADHDRKLPWTCEHQAVLMFADISGFTALCERYTSDPTTGGIDQLARTLNSYLGELVEEIIGSGGDVIKFAGDAILSVWRINEICNFANTVDTVISCCLGIQKQCGEWNTDIGVQLTIKLGVSAGDISITYIGNDECRSYVELGTAVSDVNTAEGYCKSGYIVLSPKAWALCKQAAYDYEMMDDDKHVRIVSKMTYPSGRRFSLRGRRLSVSTGGEESVMTMPSIPAVETPEVDPEEQATPNANDKLSKLRSIVKKVTGLNLEEKLRLYVTSPVLKKLDAGQPLEYLSEMRQVSVVFMNLILDEETNTTQLLQDVFDLIYMEVRAINGCFNKVFLFDKGCTFLILFGLPGYKHSSDSSRALQCSTRIKKILDTVPGVLRVSIGVTTGDAFCGVVGHKQRHEYSVIGRKVNMAARLMMHYPEKVTCDDETYHSSRVAPSNFKTLVTKRMKGLRNVGEIREFIYNEDEETELENSLSYFEFPNLGREKETEMFLKELNLLQEDTEGRHLHNHLVFVGAVGIGKTRLLDSFSVMAAKQNIKFVAFDMTTNDLYKNYFLVRHILKVLLVTAGYSQEIDTEPILVQNLRDTKLLGYLHSFSDVIGVKLKSPESLTMLVIDETVLKTKREEIYALLIQNCLEKLGPTVFLLDDMRHCDVLSWEYLNILSQCPLALMVLGVRPITVDEPSCPAAQRFFENPRTLTKDVENLDNRLMTPLACQILDVCRLQRDIDSLLRTLSHGIPKWTEQLLLDMYEKKQLLIVEEANMPSALSTVSPQSHLINKKPSKERRSSSVDRRKHIQNFETSLQTSHVEDATGFAGEMLANLGYIQTKDVEIKVNSTEKAAIQIRRVAILADGVVTKDLKIPGAMSDMVTERLDSMRALEQLIVKCCAVIGPPFSMNIIKAVLPKSSIFKIALSVRRLFINGTFECIYYRKARKVSITEDTGTSPNICCCDTQDESLDSDQRVCNNFQFRNFMFEKTAYGILMVTQRNEIHLKIVDYLLEQVSEQRKHVLTHLYFSFGSLTNDSTDSTTTEVASSKSKHPKDADKVKRFLNPVEIFNDINKSGNMLDYIQHTQTKFVSTTNDDLKALIPMYHKITDHLCVAENTARCLDILLEASSVALCLEYTDEALEFLRKADKSFIKLKNDVPYLNKKLINLTESCINRLTGKALIASGKHDQAETYIIKAATILGIYYPQSRLGVKFKMLKHKKYPSSMLTISELIEISIPHNDVDRYYLEAGNCLSDLCQLHKHKQTFHLFHLDILRLLEVLRLFSPSPQLVIEACIHLIDLYHHKKFMELRFKLEIELFSICVSVADSLYYKDICKLCDVLNKSCRSSLDNGHIQKAITTGVAALSIAKAFKDDKMMVKSYSKLALASIFNDNIENSVEMLLDMKDVVQKKTNRRDMTEYCNLLMELMLVKGHPIEPFSRCISHTTTYLKHYDVVENEMVTRFYSAMSIAVWYCRQFDWKNGQRWFDYWENYQPNQTSLLTLIGRLKKLECMLLSFWMSLDANIPETAARIEVSILKEIEYLNISIETTPGTAPRFYHLLAYFYLLKGNKSKVKKYLKKSMKIALTQENKLDFNWTKHSWKCWNQRDYQNKTPGWNKLVKLHFLDWKILSGLTDLYYSFPPPRHYQFKGKLKL